MARFIITGPLLLLLGSLGTNLATHPACAFQNQSNAGQVPPELRKVKVYHLDLERRLGTDPEKLVFIKNISYEGITLQRLVLNVYLSVKPVDHAATIQRIYFQDFRVNSLPVHLETFEQEFQLSRQEVVDLPAPVKCSIIFSELDSLKPLSEILVKDAIQITGKDYVEVKLSGVERLAMRARQIAVPVALDQQIPLHLFAGNPLLRRAADQILDTLTDPSRPAAIALAQEHLSKLVRQRTLSATARPALFLVYCEYALVDPKNQRVERFSEFGTGFVAGGGGKLLTARSVVQPWKFDPQIAFLMAHEHLKFDPKNYRLHAWPAGARVKSADGLLDYTLAANSEKQTLKLLKTTPDHKQKKEYQDPDSGERAQFELEAGGDNDLALLQLTGSNAKPLAFADASLETSSAIQATLFGFPFGINQSQADPRAFEVQATRENGAVTLNRLLNPGESGAPLLTADGKVLAIAGSASQCVPIRAAMKFLK